MNKKNDMPCAALVPADTLRSRFAAAMSDMYRAEVPLYGDLLAIVAQANQAVDAQPGDGSATRLQVERHGAIRLGTPDELRTMRRVLAVMGMQPVGYYDLSAAGVPVHSTAFRPVDAASLARNPFRLFTSLLRLELIADPALRAQAEALLRARSIFSPRLLALTALAEQNGGLQGAQADEFIQHALDTFRWHRSAPVTAPVYDAMRAQHPLVADVVCFRGPHINHLTPRTLDIDAAQQLMLSRGIRAKDTIEGPPRRACPILLRQTSFLALREPVEFCGATDATGGATDDAAQGTGWHTARFGEIEQRGAALTPKGRALYDRLLADAAQLRADGMDAAAALTQAFTQFPDDATRLRREGLAYFRYELTDPGRAAGLPAQGLDALIEQGAVRTIPLLYEDFLPVSAAGIFRSNLQGGGAAQQGAGPARGAFEAALGCRVLDEFALYESQQQQSMRAVLDALRDGVPA